MNLHNTINVYRSPINLYKFQPATMIRAAYKYPDGSEYEGEWNEQGQRHGAGRMRFADNSRYSGRFEQGLCSGQGVMQLPDGSRLVMSSALSYGYK